MMDKVDYSSIDYKIHYRGLVELLRPLAAFVDVPGAVGQQLAKAVREAVAIIESGAKRCPECGGYGWRCGRGFDDDGLALPMEYCKVCGGSGGVFVAEVAK